MRLLGSKSGQVAAETAATDARKKEEEALAAKQRRREQHQRAQEKGKAAEEARRAALATDNDPDDDDETLKSHLLALDAFTGRPLPGDTLLSALPVAAPWSALASYKYKAKIQPGSTKRGKAVKEVLSIWDHAGKDPKVLDRHSQDVERIWPREIELVRGWKEAEVVSVLPVAKHPHPIIIPSRATMPVLVPAPAPAPAPHYHTLASYCAVPVGRNSREGNSLDNRVRAFLRGKKGGERREEREESGERREWREKRVEREERGEKGERGEESVEDLTSRPRSLRCTQRKQRKTSVPDSQPARPALTHHHSAASREAPVSNTGTAQHSTAQHSTAQHSTAQHP
ncbi:hypothetical protein OPT61_g8464 [Boeremia exigua]|uniref:Uncharacterized protein n=1 Tax=Boeremia exigua TaxID=749465 RepID=A0ACC2HZ08_9PLEO|nr:hypothetical protein OPT61_g8464 [Boeremia exigua]